MATFIFCLFLLCLISLFFGLSFMAHVGFLLYVSGILGAAMLIAIIYSIVHKPKRKRSRRSDLGLGDSEADRLLAECFRQGIDSFNYIQDTLPEIADRDIKTQLREMQDKARKLFQYLERHPKKITLARRFIDYYQDTTASLVMKYVEIEKTGLHTSDVEDIKIRTTQTLYNLNRAYTEQFAKIVSDQLMDMDAELKVMNDAIAADGYHIQEDMPDFTAPSANSTADAGTSPHRPPFPRRRQHISFLTAMTQRLFHTDPPVVRQKLILTFLAIFLGGFGAHKFYLGKPGWGLLYILFCWTFIPSILGIIAGIRFLMMSGPEFERTYFPPAHYDA